jgi:hypothetical protein
MTLQFFDGITDCLIHIDSYIRNWEYEELHPQLWVHQFFHSLGNVLQPWYVREETRRQIKHWIVLLAQFCQEFSFVGKYLDVTNILHLLKR